MRYLVDTDWIADYLKGRLPAVQLLDSLVDDGIAISIISYAELLEGVYYGHDPVENEAVFRRFLHGVEVLGLTRKIAEQYARISGRLRTQGLLIPSPDLFIAATALQRQLTVVTRNRRHFERVPELRLL